MSYDYNALVQKIGDCRRRAFQLLNNDAPTSTPNDPPSNMAAAVHLLQDAVETFDSLSSYCPMTPLLWIHYADTMAEWIKRCGMDSFSAGSSASSDAAIKMQLEIVALGLIEFPGSALLHLYNLHLLSTTPTENDSDAKNEKTNNLEKHLEYAIECIGRGSHANEGDFVAALYQYSIDYYLQRQQLDRAVAVLLDRARYPAKHVNDSLRYELQLLLSSQDALLKQSKVPSTAKQYSHVFDQLEENRRSCARVFGQFAIYEDEIDAAMHQEGILGRFQCILAATTDQEDNISNAAFRRKSSSINWNKVLEPRGQQYSMGLGGLETANAFIKYAIALQKFRVTHEDEDADDERMEEQNYELLSKNIPDLALAVYERGVAECPTVEAIWLAYIRLLKELLSSPDKSKHLLAATRIQSVANRATRNCPFSMLLVQEKMLSCLLMAEYGHLVFDPEVVLKIAQDAIDSKFLPGPDVMLALYLTSIRLTKRRILILLQSAVGEHVGKHIAALRYDEPEPLPSSIKAKSNLNGGRESVLPDDETTDEIGDLLDDLAEVYDQVCERIRKAFKEFTTGLAAVLKDRAETETLLSGPLRACLIKNCQDSQLTTENLIFYEKAIKAHNPPSPDLYSKFIHQCMADLKPSNAMDVMRKIRHLRFLFQKGINAVGKPKENSVSGEYEVTLSSLGKSWLDFEHCFGSERSLGRASKMIEKKMKKVDVQKDKEEGRQLKKQGTKRNRAGSFENQGEPLSSPKKQKTEAQIKDFNQASDPTSTKKPEDIAEKVEENEDNPKMEAEGERQNRHEEKHAAFHPFTVQVSKLSVEAEDMDLVDCLKPVCGPIVHARIIRDKHSKKSKGWALVQFEERAAAEKALSVSGALGIKEKLIHIERSHMPAVSLVPPGMHRVKPKGDGKHTKRNEKYREKAEEGSRAKATTTTSDTTHRVEKTFRALDFRPRSVARPKPKLSLDRKES